MGKESKGRPGGEYNGVSKSNKATSRRSKEKEHFSKKPKSPKKSLQHNESRRASDRELVSRFMSGAIDEDDIDYDY